MATWQEKLAADEIVLIDGGMGTELERVGAQMNARSWSGAAVIEAPDVGRRVHFTMPTWNFVLRDAMPELMAARA